MVEQAQFRLEEARALARLGQEEEAAALAMELSSSLAGADPFNSARVYALLAEIFADLGQADRALELYELAAELFEFAQPNRYLLDAYAKLADLLEERGRKDEAYAFMKKAVAMQQAVSSNKPS